MICFLLKKPCPPTVACCRPHRLRADIPVVVADDMRVSATMYFLDQVPRRARNSRVTGGLFCIVRLTGIALQTSFFGRFVKFDLTKRLPSKACRSLARRGVRAGDDWH
ncbi:hypothetical protein [Niveibacterium microcysteis]|uniref:Uncharacterized protein n=1 Tax=Niveibacterium microcysteis TaxID=2811415 RepID=A0ABX7MEZ3_9RHOO|nr:hypothetical protein [Niveibacterium microcysteis]QSI78497.1 hypothetical protein JY500_07765 [Niveibacterium microcysteis]